MLLKWNQKITHYIQRYYWIFYRSKFLLGDACPWVRVSLILLLTFFFTQVYFSRKKQEPVYVPPFFLSGPLIIKRILIRLIFFLLLKWKHHNLSHSVCILTDASRWHNAAHPCTHNAVLWLPVALLLVILLFEAAMTVVFLRMRSKFKNVM